MPSNFDFHRCKWLSERLEGNPVYVQKLEDWELADLQNYADHLHGIAQKYLSDHHRLYLERGEQPVLSLGNFPEYVEAERLKALVDREQTRRLDVERDTLVDQVRKMREGNKPARSGDTKPAPLPTLEEVTKDAANFLPRLWAALADLQPPAFDMNGNFISDRERGQDAALYALAHALVVRGKIADGIKPERVYQILCARYGRTPAKRLDKITRGKADFPTFRDDFLDTIQDIE